MFLDALKDLCCILFGLLILGLSLFIAIIITIGLVMCDMTLGHGYTWLIGGFIILVLLFLLCLIKQLIDRT